MKKSFNEWRAWVESQPETAFIAHDYVAWGSSATLYSGRNGENFRETGNDCLDQGSHTIEDTLVGKILSEANLWDSRSSGISPEEAATVWADASHRFAKNASGKVLTNVTGAIQDRTFRNIELPELLKNEKIDSINGIPREELAGLNRKEAFEKIVEAEIARDDSRGRDTKNEDLTLRATKKDGEIHRLHEFQKTGEELIANKAAKVIDEFPPPPPPPPPTVINENITKGRSR